MTGITVEGLPEFERTTAAAARELGDLSDSHRTAGEVLVQRPQPRVPAVAANVSYDVEAGLTTVTGDVIYDGPGGGAVLDSSQTAQIIDAFRDEIAQIVTTIHGT